ncbi:MAG TPA: cytochrome P450 [Steroidobacteraceae bacterium]|nr:cytochrome P450 [Steroidobacteraceae bacterium]
MQTSNDAEERGAETIAAGFDPERLPTAFFADPYPTYAALQTHDSVHRCPDGTYFLTRYADLDAIYRDRTHFCSDKRAIFAPKFGSHSPLYAHHTTSLVFNDPPYHTRVRRQIVGALSPAAIKAMTPGLGALIERLCDAIEAKGRFDAIADFAAAIPVEVIGNLLGVPRDERGALRGWSLSILGALDPALSPEALERGNRSVSEFLDFTRTLVAERRRQLRGDDDLLSRLIRDETGGEPLSETELLHNCIFLLNAGHETTTNLIGNGLWLFLDDAAARRRLREEPALIATAVEECLRCESPNQLGNRLVVTPVELGGRVLPAGTYLTLCIGAANRDPAEFKEPSTFDIGRDPNRHLAFAAGSHACAGMSVARLEGQMAIAGFLRRFPGARLTEGARRNRRARFRGFESLPAAVE